MAGWLNVTLDCDELIEIPPTQTLVLLGTVKDKVFQICPREGNLDLGCVSDRLNQAIVMISLCALNQRAYWLYRNINKQGRFAIQPSVKTKSWVSFLTLSSS